MCNHKDSYEEDESKSNDFAFILSVLMDGEPFTSNSGTGMAGSGDGHDSKGDKVALARK